MTDLNWTWPLVPHFSSHGLAAYNSAICVLFRRVIDSIDVSSYSLSPRHANALQPSQIEAQILSLTDSQWQSILKGKLDQNVLLKEMKQVIIPYHQQQSLRAVSVLPLTMKHIAWILFTESMTIYFYQQGGLILLSKVSVPSEDLNDWPQFVLSTPNEDSSDFNLYIITMSGKLYLYNVLIDENKLMNSVELTMEFGGKVIPLVDENLGIHLTAACLIQKGFITAQSNGLLNFWNTNEFECVAHFSCKNGYISHLAVENELLAVGTTTGKIYLFNKAPLSSRWFPIIEMGAHASAITSLLLHESHLVSFGAARSCFKCQIDSRNFTISSPTFQLMPDCHPVCSAVVYRHYVLTTNYETPSGQLFLF